MKVINLVSKFIAETRGHPLAVTVPEAQLLHDFATWVDRQSAEHSVQSDGAGTLPESGEYFVEYVESNIVRLTPRR